MTTGQNIIDQIRDDLQDATDLSFDANVFLRFINRGATEFCATTGSLQDTQTINTDGTNFSFILSTNLTNPVKIFKVEFAGIPLSQTYIHEIRTQYGATSATPTSQTGWYEFNDKLYLEVIAPTATGSDALNVFYLRTPTDMTSVGDTFDFPAIWQPAIVEFAVAKAFASQRDSILEAEHMAKYEAARQTAFAINKAVLQGDAV